MPVFKFQGVDFLEFDSLLTDDERLVRDTTRKFIEDNLIPIIEECNRAGRFPTRTGQAHGRTGLLRRQPQRLRLRRHVATSNTAWSCRSWSAATAACARFVSVQSALCMYPIYAFGSDEQKENWLPAMHKGEKLGCFGLTEPDFGSNPGGMRTRAEKSGKEYVLNGEKMWITSGSIADVAIIWAKVEDEDDQIRGFLVETDRPGFNADDVHGKWSLRASVTSGPVAAGRAHSRVESAAQDRTA